MSFYLRKSFLDELAAVVAAPDATDNDRLVCASLLRNAAIAAEGFLPICQDTGTATVFAWRGERVITGGDDENLLAKGVERAWENNYLRESQVAAYSLFGESNTANNLPPQIDIRFAPGGEYTFLFIVKGGGSANKTVFFQKTKAFLQEDVMERFLREQIKNLGVAACPPYHLCLVVGGKSAEENLRYLKLATTGILDDLPTEGDGSGRPFRDPQWEARALRIAAETGLGAQFGGRYLALQARVIRLSRHSASCPVSIGVSCSAHRNMLGKITADGVFLEQLEREPSRYLEEIPAEASSATSIDLNRPVAEILQCLRELPVGSMVRLDGTMVVGRDMAHARFREMIQSGQKLPDYLLRHPLCYAGPARTPPGYTIGSIGPTTAQRMDEYLDELMSRGASLITLAKGNRSETAVKACAKHGGFYLGTIGGAAALIAREHIVSSEVIDFPELGMEAVHRMEVRGLPAFIIYDDRGNKLY